MKLWHLSDSWMLCFWKYIVVLIHVRPEARVVGKTLNSGPGVVTAWLELHCHLQGQTHRLLVLFITHSCRTQNYRFSHYKKSPKPINSTMLSHLINHDKMKRQPSISVIHSQIYIQQWQETVFFYPWWKQIFSVSVMSGCYWAEGLMTAGQNSHLLHPPHFAPKVTMETPPAHLMPWFL